MKKRAALFFGMILVLVLGGCGVNQMDAVEQIRSQETITVEELALLARTENIHFEMQKQWQPQEGSEPLTIVRTKADDLLLIWDSEQIPGGRASIQQAGWATRLWWAGEEKPAVVEQALASFSDYPAEQYFCYPFTAKNLLVYALIPGQRVTMHSGQQEAVSYQNRPGNLTMLRQLFWQDINQMTETHFQAVSADFAVHIGCEYYSTPVSDGASTSYDQMAQYMLICQPLNPQAFTPGEPITITVQGPFSGQRALMSVTLEEATPETLWVLNWGPKVSVSEKPLDGSAQFTVTISSGGHTETLELVEQLDATVSSR